MKKTSADIALPGDPSLVLSNAVRALVDAERQLDSISDDELIGAFQWIRDADALLRVRKASADLIVPARRIEAKILRRLGQLGELTGLPQHLRAVARGMAEVDDAAFTRFLDVLDKSTVASNWRDFVRVEAEEERRSRVREWARDGGIPSDTGPTRSTIRNAARIIANEVANGSQETSTGDIAVTLAEALDVDIENEVIKHGLYEIGRAALARNEREDRRHASYVEDDGPPDFRRLWGNLPKVIAFQTDDGDFVRIPWKMTTLDQLKFYADMRDQQSEGIRASAESLRNLYEMLSRVRDRLKIEDTDSCSDILQLGRMQGWITQDDGRPMGDAFDKFPKMFEEVSLSGGISQSLDRLTKSLGDHGIYAESDLDEEIAITLAPALFTGSNRKTMEAFARAYAPTLVNTFFYPWERPLDPEEALARDARLTEAMSRFAAERG